MSSSVNRFSNCPIVFESIVLPTTFCNTKGEGMNQISHVHVLSTKSTNMKLYQLFFKKLSPICCVFVLMVEVMVVVG